MGMIVVADARAELGRLEAELRRLRAQLEPDVVFESWAEVTWRFTFRTDRERFAIRLDDVWKVLPMCELTSAPEAPAWMPGLLNLHGQLIPVLDVQARIEGKQRRTRASDFIVVARRTTGLVGLVVAEAIGAESVDGGQLQPVSRDLPHAPYVVGAFESRTICTLALSLQALIATSDIPESSHAKQPVA